MGANYKTIKGDLLNAIGVIIHGVNNVGIMGSGVARGVKNRYPKAFAIYAEAHYNDMLKIGSVTLYRDSRDVWIANAVTQHLGIPNPLDYNGLFDSFAKTLEMIVMIEVSEGRELGSIAINFPMIGAGRGGGDWTIIEENINLLLEEHNKNYNLVRPANLYVVDVEPNDCR